jgi:hypothetical protein
MWKGRISVQVINIYLHFVIVREYVCHLLGILKNPCTILAWFAEDRFGGTEAKIDLLFQPAFPYFTVNILRH